MSSPASKREQSTSLKNSTSARAHNLTFYKRDIAEFSGESAAPSAEALRQRTIEELEKKVEIVLRHNSHLLAENGSLGELLNDKNAEIEMLVGRLEQQLRGEETSMAWVEVEKKRLLEDFARLQEEHNGEIRKLLDEISKLHDQCFDLDALKTQELQRVRDACEKETFMQIQAVKKSYGATQELLESQVRVAKEALEQKGFELESVQHQHRLELDRQADEIKHLQGEVKHAQKLKAMELEECKARYESEMHAKLRDAQRKAEIDQGGVESLLRKLRKELADKTLDLERVSNKLGAAVHENEDELQVLKKEKEQLRMEIEKAEMSYKDSLRNERDKIRRMTDLELQNMENANTNYTNSLKSEVEKLYELSECKTGEIKSLFDQLQSFRDASKKEAEYLGNLNEQLRKQLSELHRRNLEELELLKIKMAELHQGDIAALKSYYENQILVQAEHIAALQKQLEETRGKLHKELQSKNELRKEFEIELSKEKAKNADLKVRLAALNVEMKEQVTSMASKMSLTSQTLLREADLKLKGQAFLDEEKRKLHHLINAKDKEIADLTDQAERAKKEKEANQNILKDEIAQLREFNKELESSLQKERGFNDVENRKKEAKAKEEIDSLREELNHLKTVDKAELSALVDKLQKENIKLQKDLQHSEREHRNVMTELGIRNGFVETMQLESSAAIEEERTKVKVLMNKNEISMKTYFEEKVAQR